MPKRAVQLGQQLRRLRKTQNLTLDQLSLMAGVSKAMLSQVEQNKINPTVAIILKIADALKVSIGELIEDTPRRYLLQMIHASQEHYTFRKEDACEIRTLSPLSLEKSVEFYRIRLEKGGALRSEAHYAGTEEILYVAKGKITVASGDQTVDVPRGDSIHYRADVPHHLSNAGKATAEAFLIVRYRETSLR